MRTMGESSPPASPETPVGRSRDWIRKEVVVPVGVAVLGALLVVALTPVGDGVRELLFPTKADVTGTVFVSGQAAEGADLTLDGEDAGNVDAEGKFLLAGVGAGTHVLQLEALGAYPREREFAVQREMTTFPLGVIELEPFFQLGYVVTPGSPWFNEQAQTFVVPYDLTLWIRGDPEVMNRIKSVSYTLPAPLPSASVIGRSAPSSFCFEKAGELTAQEFGVVGAGPSATATADVDLGEGQSVQLSTEPGNLPPPTCPRKQAPSSQPSPSPSAPPTSPSASMPSRSPSPSPSRSPSSTLVTVPDVVCRTYASAKAELEGLGLRAEQGEPVLPRQECPAPVNVARQDIKPGSGVPPGTVIVLHLGEPTPTPSPSP